MLSRIEVCESGARLRLYGVLDGAGAERVRDRFAALVGEQRGDVVLDFGNVGFMDGAGVGALAFLFKRLSSAGRRLRLTGVTGQPLALLRELELAGVFELAAPRRSRRWPMASRWAA
jgi:anti-anti-sigma factor